MKLSNLMRAQILPILCSLGAQAFAEGYGSLNNFDAVNDNGTPTHGFEIEIEDAVSTDISYTYDYNHYGTPRITQDDSIPGHPKVRVRYESTKNPDGTWAAYTAVPSVPLLPTDGHQFTDPSVNIGGEHFGVGFVRQIGAVSYHWLIDDGSGNLIHGTALQIATPTFNYMPQPAAPPLVQAVIQPPPEIPVLEFGAASWVKEIRTVSHNNHHVELRDLVSDDPDDPDDSNWANGEPDEVETEWRLMQREFNKPDGGANGELQGGPEELPGGDETITRRYEFFNYVGPLDNETGEAMADSVGPDDIHGVGVKTVNGVEVDLSTVEVVGAYIGAQMAGYDAAGEMGLIDNLQDGTTSEAYVNRRLVIAGTPPITIELTGALPDGMAFDSVEGILSGTPTTSGSFSFSVHAVDSAGADLTKNFTLAISGEAPLASVDQWSVF